MNNREFFVVLHIMRL